MELGIGRIVRVINQATCHVGVWKTGGTTPCILNIVWSQGHLKRAPTDSRKGGLYSTRTGHYGPLSSLNTRTIN
jgi:hypothetical protein